MFIDMVVMPEVQVSIMEIVGVAIVRYGLMPTRRAVHMTMASVFVACTFHRINLHCNQIANAVQEDVGMTAQLNPVLVLLIRPFIGLCSALIEKRSVYRRGMFGTSPALQSVCLYARLHFRQSLLPSLLLRSLDIIVKPNRRGYRK
jgi:hypothetical protein